MKKLFLIVLILLGIIQFSSCINKEGDADFEVLNPVDSTNAKTPDLQIPKL